MRNANRREDLEAIRAQVLENLRDLPPVPSVPMTRAPAPTKVIVGSAGNQRVC